ncbi:MAG: hypothetical protein U1E76_06555 [Planctomycetota bacterium]
MSCAHARKLIQRELDDQSSIDDVLWLDQHVRGCPACASARRRGRQLEELLWSLPVPAAGRLDLTGSITRVNRAIDAGIAARARARTRRRRRWWMAGLAAAAAAAILLARSDWPRRARAPAPGRAMLAEPEPWTAPAPSAPVGDDERERLDHKRLEAMRDRVRDLFQECMTDLAAGAPRADVVLCAQRFDAGARLHRAGGWPVVRIVQGLVRDPDAAVARAAVRYLGVRGDTLAMETLKDALRVPAIQADVVRALGDAGDAGLATLALALRDASLEALALTQLARQRTAAAARVIEKEIQRAREAGRAPQLLPWFDALASMGEVAVPSLLELAATSELEPLAIGALAHTDGARAGVAGIAAEAGARPGVLLPVIGELGVVAALPYVEQQCRAGAARDQALACLAALGGPDALRVLVRLVQGGRLLASLAASVAAPILDRDAEAATSLVDVLVGDGDSAGARVLLDLLTERTSVASVPALVALARCDLLHETERERAVAAVAAAGTREQVGAMRNLLAGALPSEHRFAAAVVASIAALGGDAAAEASVADLARDRGVELSRRATRQLLDGMSSRTRIAQVLKPVIQSQSPKTGGPCR